ncbi:MAG: DUF5110 domain-containing protein [Treponema sp.]|nr:DUF5110 domain-containing protein [Treponema sp.]
MKDLYKINEKSETLASNICKKGSLRISVLTPSLIRLEWSKNQSFVDAPTQKVWHRAFPQVPFIRQDSEKSTVIETDQLCISCKEAENLRDAVQITLKHPAAEWNVITGLVDRWSYGDKITTLPGTARTLDNSNGEIPLEDSIISRKGFTVLDDSKSCIIMPGGEVAPREEKDGIDIYFFAYGHDYKTCLADFFRLTGKPPLLPRWALGNWWSRYHKYTDKEYLELMEQFKKKHIPLSVAMIDMDWHITQIEKDIGSGWTGYTWNKEYFPKPQEFLSELHERGLKVSLNVHPAEGVGRHEKAYSAMAKALGIKADGKTIPFDISDSKFIESYFEELHYPLEEQGVDFWWIDWQQGSKTSTEGLDPLWLLNHYHYLDNSKGGKRPLILSRYSGPGSQRYPVGFSGDTVISWKSLAFQPYFTASASNIGYGWWSHDIGGHMLGSYDEELQVRWVQLGVFSPIMRLHSSSSRFNHKEPWKYDATAEVAITRYLRFRHQLLPYLYTMNERFSRTGEPLIAPMYHQYPDETAAYSVPNEYFFGSELVCAPITEPCDKELNRAPVTVWLPEGDFTDIFTGCTYTGGRIRRIYRQLQNMPVFLKSGGILPLAAESVIEKDEILPSHLEIYLAAGIEQGEQSENAFTLYEDDGESLAYKEGKSVTTKLTLTNGKKSVFTIHAPEGERALLPAKRTYTLHFMNSNRPKSLKLRRKGVEEELDFAYDSLSRKTSATFELPADDEAVITLATEQTGEPVQAERCAELLDKAKIDFVKKDQLFQLIKENEKNPLAACQELLFRKESRVLTEALMELLESR